MIDSAHPAPSDPSERAPIEGAQPGESRKERVDRELQELLNEVRVAIPGAEVLFAFLLGVAFTERFGDTTTLQRAIYFGALLTTAGSTALLIAPTAHHRLRFRSGDKEELLYRATRLALTALALLAASITAVVFLVGDVLYGSRSAALAGAFIAAWFSWFWFGLPLLRRPAR